MALKAGYKGIKKNVLDSLLTLLGSVVIKEIGDGLTLDSDGELSADINDVGDGLTLSESGTASVDIDSNTMEFTEDGKLKAKITSGFSMEQIYYGNGEPATRNTDVSLISGKHFSDYDMLIFDIGQPDDGGISVNAACNQKCLWLADPALAISGKWSCGDYYQRSISISIDVEHDTFNYSSVASSESDGYSMRIYAIQGVKF